MNTPFLNLDALQPVPIKGGGGDVPEGFRGSAIADIGKRIGARQLGCNLTVVPPGKAAFPAHNHHGMEEMFLILEGEGELRVGAQRWPVRAGDVIACPTGGPETAHQLRNTSTDRLLKYFAVSTLVYPDLVEYPDSGKIGAVMYSPDGREVRLRNRAEDNLDYWDGEA
jgi:uncharacterized cupin superfamily protein